MELDRNAILKCFLTEAEESLSAMEQAILRLEDDPHNTECLHAIFRIVHNLKGNTAALSLGKVSEFAHALESLLDKLRDQEIPVTPDTTTLLLQAVDTFQSVMSRLRSGEQAPEIDEAPKLLAAIDSLNNTGNRESVEDIPDRVHAAAPTERDSRNSSATLRVDIEKVDRLVNLAGEIAIARGRLTSALQRAGVPGDIVDLDHASDILYSEMQELVMRLRMVPLGPSLAQLSRTVRDTAKCNGKSVRLEISGAEVELDTRVIELIRSPLVHLIRNAVDHGIEPPHIREANGKPKCGIISLQAGQEAGNVIIRVSDDGAGLNLHRIRERARELGYLADSEQVSDHELYQLIFEPGFSTASEVTEISGRGVGMDVVRKNIESLRGSVTIDSHPGQGTTVLMRIPLTLAIIDGFAVQVEDNTYVIPLEYVFECIETARESNWSSFGGVAQLRGEPLPFIRLRNVFGLEHRQAEREQIIVVQNESMRFGLAVDSLDGEIQAVVKPLGKTFASAKEFSGATILADGRVALLLDITWLAQRVTRSQFRRNEVESEEY